MLVDQQQSSNRKTLAMFISVIILGVCIACQVNTEKAVPSSTSYADLTTNSESSQNNDESTELNSGLVNGEQGTSNETYTTSVYESETEPTYELTALLGATRVDKLLSRGKLTYHVGIYSKLYIPYMQICGGTLVTLKAVISAAHCFWNEEEGTLSPTLFAVGAGKRFRPWNYPLDNHGQQSDVAEIHIPIRYRGSASSFQEDIAVVLLAKKFEFNFAIRPACVSFDEDFDNEQLKEGSLGIILGWGLTQQDGGPSQILNYLELPAVSIEKCINSSDASFRRYITSDKICAGVITGKAMCRGDSGGGLVFADERADERSVPYLRAVASTAPRNKHECNAYALAALTHLRAHRDFVRRHIPGVEEECEKTYSRLGYRFSQENEDENVKGAIQFVCNCACDNSEPTIKKIKLKN